MIKTKLDLAFDWQAWQSTPDDMLRMDLLVIKRILFDLFLIHEFEETLLRLYQEGCVWGPVHSSVGQEAVAAASIAALRKTDKIAGTHRAHHQFLAKVMKHATPDSWDPCREALPVEASLAVKRTLAEIMGLAPGYCGGRGGSMHLRHAEAGVIGTNAIVGGGIPLATGTAFAEKFKHTDQVVLCFFGDGATNQGVFHEACNIAGIWNLPIIYFVENNLYAVATPSAEVCAVKDLSAHAAVYGMNGRVVNGMDPLAIYAVIDDSARSIRGGGRSCIIECKCYRHYHQGGEKRGSAFGYRSRREEDEWLERDALVTFPAAVLQAGLLEEPDLLNLRELAQSAMMEAVDYCTLQRNARIVRPELWPRVESLREGVRSDGREWQGVSFSDPETFTDLVEMKYSDAIAAVTGRWLEKDDRVVVLGEDVANFKGGAYGATKQLPERFPKRVLNTPISEAGFAGLACGAAMSGLRPVVEIMYPDFTLVAADQLFNQISKLRYMYGNTTDMPLVVRTRVAIGCGYGGQHSMDPAALYALFPGWRIVAPSNALDYVGLFNSAMHSLDPVLIIEHHSLYGRKFPLPKDNLDYFIPFGKARVTREGKDVTLITYGCMVGRCEKVQARLAEKHVSAEIIDLRSIDFPSIDYDLIGGSVAKTGAAVVVEESPRSQSLGATIANEVTERFFEWLDAPVLRLNSADVPNPVSRVLESAAILGEEEIVTGVMSAARRKWNGDYPSRRTEAT